MNTATLTCPKCGHKQPGEIPINSCVPFYVCEDCKQTIKAHGEDCCVFCSYADKPCPLKSKDDDGSSMIQQTTLSKPGRRRLKKERQRQERRQEQRLQARKKTMKAAFTLALAVGAIAALFWFAAARPGLPPISMDGHIEQSPPGHILDAPIPENIQKHMLEHADGKGKPGVIIQYNCSDFDCASDLVAKLTALAQAYPDYVYLAPNTYDGKIIATKLGERQIWSDFDEQAIREFIE